MFYQQMKIEQQRLQTQIKQIQQQLSDLPEGNLICAKNGTHFKWYYSHDHQVSYLPRRNQSLAEQLSKKKYLSCLLQDLLQRQSAVDAYLSNHPGSNMKSDKLLSENSGFRDLLLPYFSPNSKKIADWQNTPFESNSNYPEHLIYKSLSGNIVRSKSESMIDMYLFTHHIPFRYECALTLGEITLYPDFTILHPATGKIYYWDHHGRMDDPNYAKNVFPKMQLYNSYGITPGIQLITTFETSDSPLTFETIEHIVSFYFS